MLSSYGRYTSTHYSANSSLLSSHTDYCCANENAPYAGTVLQSSVRYYHHQDIHQNVPLAQVHKDAHFGSLLLPQSFSVPHENPAPACRDEKARTCLGLDPVATAHKRASAGNKDFQDSASPKPVGTKDHFRHSQGIHPHQTAARARRHARRWPPASDGS